MRSLLAQLPEPDREASRAVTDRAARVLRPVGALARFDAVAAWVAAWQRSDEPEVNAPAAIVFAADHGVVVEGVSAYPSEVTRAMVKALEDGVATASVMARSVGAELAVVDVGVGLPTANLARGSALNEERFAECVQVGRDSVAAASCDLLVLGEVGIGNTTAAAAVCAALFGGPAGSWTGRGAGLGDTELTRKVAVVERARERLDPDLPPLEILREVGGADLAAIAGAVVEARLRSIPVLLDGFVVCAAAAALHVERPASLAHCWAGHRSKEPGHGALLELLDMEPLLDLSMRLGEGTGALAAVPLVRLACDSVTRVATFEEWGLKRP
ncbi:MAG: nicotinate-nucleotide--dimethylbenzimidazole phosphoribosyltransferase [Actinomycetota bacterium]